MKFVKMFGIMLITLGFGSTALAQQAAPGDQPDQVDQLAELVGLDETQQKEIRSIFEDMQGEISELQAEARTLQQELQAQIKPDFDEDQIREDAEKLGDLTGEMAALSTLMQAKVDKVFTEEQRATLQERMQQMQQQMQQRQMQQQMQ